MGLSRVLLLLCLDEFVIQVLELVLIGEVDAVAVNPFSHFFDAHFEPTSRCAGYAVANYVPGWVGGVCLDDVDGVHGFPFVGVAHVYNYTPSNEGRNTFPNFFSTVTDL